MWTGIQPYQKHRHAGTHTHTHITDTNAGARLGKEIVACAEYIMSVCTVHVVRRVVISI